MRGRRTNEEAASITCDGDNAKDGDKSTSDDACDHHNPVKKSINEPAAKTRKGAETGEGRKKKEKQTS